MTTVRIGALETLEIAEDGGTITVGAATAEGTAVTLALPRSCADSLLMTLPTAIETALRRDHGDPSLRLVFPLGRWRIERGPGGRLLLGLATADGFAVQFGIAAGDARALAAALADDPPAARPRPN